MTLQDLEYFTTSIENGVTVRKSDSVCSITLRRGLKNILARLWLLSLLGFSAIFWIAIAYIRGVRVGGTGWDSLVLPCLLLLSGIAQIVWAMQRLLFPITFEAYHDKLVLKWRTWTDLRSQAWSRQSVRVISAERLRVQNHLLRRWFLVLQTSEQGKVAIVGASRAQLEVVARTLRSFYSMPEESHPALKIQKPKRCPHRLVEWSGGILLIVPPRLERTGVAAIALFMGAVASLVFRLLLKPDPDYPPLATWLWAGIVFVLVAGFSAMVLRLESMRRLRRFTNVVVAPGGVRVTQTGLVNPMNVTWTPSQIAQFAAERVAPGVTRVILLPREGLPLTIRDHERADIAEWMVCVLRTALQLAHDSAPKTVSTANATPPPAPPAPPDAA